MNPLCTILLPNERSALIAALRRDAENERSKALRDPGWADYHLQNARLNVRVLEAFGYRLDEDQQPVGPPCPERRRLC